MNTDPLTPAGPVAEKAMDGPAVVQAAAEVVRSSTDIPGLDGGNAKMPSFPTATSTIEAAIPRDLTVPGEVQSTTMVPTAETTGLPATVPPTTESAYSSTSSTLATLPGKVPTTTTASEATTSVTESPTTTTAIAPTTISPTIPASGNTTPRQTL